MLSLPVLQCQSSAWTWPWCGFFLSQIKQTYLNIPIIFHKMKPGYICSAHYTEVSGLTHAKIALTFLVPGTEKIHSNSLLDGKGYISNS